MRSSIVIVMLICDLLMSSVVGIQLYIKVRGEFIAIPGDYVISQASTPMTHDSDFIRNTRSLEIGTVSIDDELVQKTPEEILSIYAQFENDPSELRKVLAPADESSTGDCVVRETLTWPARCYPVSGGTMHICRSNARGIIEVRGTSCSQRMNMYDLFTRSTIRKR